MTATLLKSNTTTAPKVRELSDEMILRRAANIIERKFLKTIGYSGSTEVKQFCEYRIGNYDREVFAVMFLNSQNQLIEFKEMFFGTIDSCSVYPAEIAKEALKLNAASIIITHNHPSGYATPSQADKNMTDKIVRALKLFDIRVLDHIVVGLDSTSFADIGLL